MHPEQEAFEKQIDANPLDGDNHLIYADWLDDHGQSDEAAFRRSMGEWVKRAPLANVLKGGGGFFYNMKSHPLPKGLGMNRPLGNKRQRAGNWEGFDNYRHMENALREAFMKNRQQSQAEQFRRRMRARRFSLKNR